MANKTPRSTTTYPLVAVTQPPNAARNGLRVAPDHTPAPPDDLAIVHAFERSMKIACQDLFDDPFNPDARADLVATILRDSNTADAARHRLDETLAAARQA